MDTTATVTPTAHFDRHYQLHLKHLKLKGLQPKTIDAYARAIRRIGDYFELVPFQRTPRSTKSVVHRRSVRSLATNQKPAGGGQRGTTSLRCFFRYLIHVSMPTPLEFSR